MTVNSQIGNEPGTYRAHFIYVHHCKHGHADPPVWHRQGIRCSTAINHLTLINSSCLKIIEVAVCPFAAVPDKDITTPCAFLLVSPSITTRSMLSPRKVLGPEGTLRKAQFPAGMVTFRWKILISGGVAGYKALSLQTCTDIFTVDARFEIFLRPISSTLMAPPRVPSTDDGTIKGPDVSFTFFRFVGMIIHSLLSRSY